MQPNEPSNGRETDAEAQSPAGPEEHPAQDSALTGGQGQDVPVNDVAPEEPANPDPAPNGDPRPFQNTAQAPPSGPQGTPRFSPPEGTGPGWATGPESTGHPSYVFPGAGHQAAPGPNAPGTGVPGQNTSGPGVPPGSTPGQGPATGPFGPGPSGPQHTAAFAVGRPGGPGPYGGPFGQPPFGPPQEAPKKRGGGRIVGIAAATALVTSLIVGPAAALGTAYLLPGAEPISSLTGEQGSTATEGAVGEVADQVLPSVVSIQTSQGGGSGVILSSDGQILTNAHVVDSATDGRLQVRFNDGSAADAEILGSDPVSDIAVIQAQGRDDLTPATLGDSDQVGVGGDVVAIGSPLGLSGTVTTGVVSALNRPVNTGATESGGAQTSTVINAIQTDAAINPGNSGGPLVNMAGEVIGINTAIAGLSQESGSVGLGFAIPINQVRPIAEQLVAEGSASYPAIQATIAPARSGGAQIMEVTDGGAAAEAGLKEGDVVVSLEGEAVNSPDQLIAQIRAHQPGDEVTLGVVSEDGGSPKDVQVTLGEQSAGAAAQEEPEED